MTPLFPVLISLIILPLQTPVALRNTGQALGSEDSRCVVLGDMDEDGDLDAFVANTTWQGQDGANRVFLNQTIQPSG